MRNKIKKSIPRPILEKLKIIRNYGRSISLFRKDKQRFLRYFSKTNTHEEEQLKARLLFFSHSIEKGLSRENFRYGFGQTVIPELYELIQIYHELGYDQEDETYLNAVSVLGEYIKIHEEKHYDLSNRINASEFKRIYCRDKLEIGGVKAVSRVTSDENQTKNFKELALNRNSVRDYQDTAVDLEKINEAIQIATKSPSVCNRQSTRVRIIHDRSLIKEVLDIQGGFKGYSLPPCLLLITTDTRYFIDVTERNQVYVDGGLFAMSLLYALEYEGLAACALNTMFDPKREHATRKLLGVNESENLIMYVTVGNFKDDYKVPKSHRLSVEQIVKYL
ncbi:nitroreductase family protein [Enterococcus hirae]|uniref:nitroreductase family protein n=1 Tax=Enterococcus hirae TaxID=1354 RepID=UPI0015F253B8|nr:nitroreductase family protein [Enterococcus hirae]EMF0269896.1 nitroreductase family protein [Enterococcus hirae]MBA5277324.1 nitroreductase family protein [Enterococcus hirae]